MSGAGPGDWPRLRLPRTRSAKLIQESLDEFDFNRAAGRLYDAVVRGAGAGFCLRGGLHLLSLLLALLVKKRRQRKARAQNLLGMLRDTMRYTAFLGSFAGVYVGVDEGIAACFGKKRTANWRAFAAGAAAGPTILLTGRKMRHDSLAIYILLRGITLLVRCGNKPNAPEWVRKLLAPTRFEHGDTALMCLCTCQIAYSWIIKPHTMPPSFIHFLNHHGGHENWYYKAARELAARNVKGLPAAPLEGLKGTPFEHVVSKVPCPWAHPGEDCDAAALSFFPAAYLRALPVYLPVYIAPAILVHREALFRGPDALRTWLKLLKGVARSSLFLAGYCTFAWRGACTGFQLTDTCTPAVISGFGWTGGLATLFEKKSRRMELAIYCLARSIESFGLCLVEWGMVPPKLVPPRMDVAMFSLAAACIMHCYSDSRGRHRDVFRSKYLNVLDFIFGNSGVELGRISHAPSTHDLFSQGSALMMETAAPVMRRVKTFVGSLESLSEMEADASSPRSAHSDPGITRKQLLGNSYKILPLEEEVRERLSLDLAIPLLEPLEANPSQEGSEYSQESSEGHMEHMEQLQEGDEGAELEGDESDAEGGEGLEPAQPGTPEAPPRGPFGGNVESGNEHAAAVCDTPFTDATYPGTPLAAEKGRKGKGKAGGASGRHGGARSVPGPDGGAQKKSYKAKPLRYKNYGWHARLSSSESSELTLLTGGEPVIDTALTDVGY